MESIAKKPSKEDKARLLLDFVKNNGMIPFFREMYDREWIGAYWGRIKAKGPTHHINISTLQSNDILCQDMDDQINSSK